jgi:hypothetical protein
VDETARWGTGLDRPDQNRHLAKVRVAGSNPVIRSKLRTWLMALFSPLARDQLAGIRNFVRLSSVAARGGGKVPLFSERKRLRAQQTREAAGGSFWTDEFNPPVRMKVKLALADCCGQAQMRVVERAHALILRDTGEGRLTTAARNDVEDLLPWRWATLTWWRR